MFARYTRYFLIVIREKRRRKNGRENNAHEKSVHTKCRYKNWRVAINANKNCEKQRKAFYCHSFARHLNYFECLLEKHITNDSYQFTARCIDNHLIVYVPLICDFIWIGVGIAFQTDRIIDWYSTSIQSTFKDCDHHFWRIFYLNIKVHCNRKCRDLSTLCIFK